MVFGQKKEQKDVKKPEQKKPLTGKQPQQQQKGSCSTNNPSSCGGK